MVIYTIDLRRCIIPKLMRHRHWPSLVFQLLNAYTQWDAWAWASNNSFWMFLEDPFFSQVQKGSAVQYSCLLLLSSLSSQSQSFWSLILIFLLSAVSPNLMVLAQFWCLCLILFDTIYEFSFLWTKPGMSLTEQNLLDPAALMVSHLHCRSLASHISYLPLKAKHPEEGDHVNYYISLHKCVYFGCGPLPGFQWPPGLLHFQDRESPKKAFIYHYDIPEHHRRLHWSCVYPAAHNHRGG